MKSKKKSNKLIIPSSFRDSSGFIFFKKGILYRQVNFSYKEHYDHLISSGLFDLLVNKGLLVSHKEESLKQRFSAKAYKIIRPKVVPFISYPYEWCFSQLKDAALATIQIQKYAIEFGMILKDASAYNIQFLEGKPLLIDTLSFEVYKEGSPWVAYKQFCQHFLAPLALMSFKNMQLYRLLQLYIDGIPLDLVSSLLGFRSFFKPSIYTHINLQAKMQRFFRKKTGGYKEYHLSKKGLIVLNDNLMSVINSLHCKKESTEWANYYEETNYSTEALHDKKKIVESFLDNCNANRVWDMGANTGLFSRIASGKGIKTMSFDIDPVAVEKNYTAMKKSQEKNILPLVLDITNPSPAIGWANNERNSLKERGPADVILALAMVHHLVITYNIPFTKIANFFSEIGSYLIVEFVPKEDSQAEKMLASSLKIFPNYSKREFETCFSEYFKILNVKDIRDSKRILYFMKKI